MGMSQPTRMRGQAESPQRKMIWKSKSGEHQNKTHTRDWRTEKPCNMSGLSSDFAGLLANWQRGPALQCRRA